jgi:PIN domain nuclease of toxin-antitoxin system
MIVLDTHTWIWWVHDPIQLTEAQIETITSNETDLIGISAISCWQVAKLVEVKRLELPLPLEAWFRLALSYPGVQILALTPEVAIESTHLPLPFHRDPADQIIVATARLHRCPLVTSDEKILRYRFVVTVA